MTHVVDTSVSPYARLRSVPCSAVRLTDDFWTPRRAVNRSVTLPTQFQHIEQTGRLDNFRRASGKRPDLDFQGIYFNDSDVYKWLEAASTELPDAPELAGMVQTAVEEITAAQQADGYLNTYFMFERAKDRWSNLKDMHELYCAGHLIQAAVAHYRATDSHALLDVARRLADHICATFGPEGRPGACGHEEIEMALVELYRATGEMKYRQQAVRFIDLRGSQPSVMSGGSHWDRRYMQDHVPFRELDEVTGHAVRMMYLSAGATDVYLETGDPTLWDALERQWANMTQRRMYVSGGLGSRYEGEAFGKDYELPNDRAYTETCAAIGSVMWNYRMLLVSGQARFADLMEHTLYNAVLPGLSLDGKEYFYQNPLASDGTHRRQPWFGCACCPPNVARLLAQVPGYFYSADDRGSVYVHLYGAGEACFPLPSGEIFQLRQETGYPYDGAIALTILQAPAGACRLFLRVPAWARGASLAVNDVPQAAPQPGTYLMLYRVWEQGDVVRLTLPFEPRFLHSHPYADVNSGHVAVMRGPLLYGMEAVDNCLVTEENPTPLADLRDFVLPKGTCLSVGRCDSLPGVRTLSGTGLSCPPETDSLYSPRPNTLEGRPVPFTLIPYYAWANREPGQMRVWFRYSS